MYRNSDLTKRAKPEPFRHSGDAGRRVFAHRRGYPLTPGEQISYVVSR